MWDILEYSIMENKKKEMSSNNGFNKFLSITTFVE